MPHQSSCVPEILAQLESFYGAQEPCWPTDPYLFLVWWHCGYPASDAACAKGWESLIETIGVRPKELFLASAKKLSRALRPGGMNAEVRAKRLKQIAERVQNEFGGELRRHLFGPLPQVRQILKQFPNIGDPGVDRILLFSGVAPLPAVPSNCPHVLVRITRGQEQENYATTYKEAAKSILQDVPETFDARTRAYLLLKRHGQELCKRANPRCDQCPVNTCCRFYIGKLHGAARISTSLKRSELSHHVRGPSED